MEFRNSFTLDGKREAAMKYRILHVLDSISSTSIPYEWCNSFDKVKYEIKIICFHKSKVLDDPRVTILQARNKFDLEAIKKLDSYLKDNRFDLVHTHHNISGGIARILAKKNKVPCIVDTEHGSHKSYKLIGNIFNDLTLFLADRIINVSGWVRDSYYPWEKVFIPMKYMLTVYNGANLDQIKELKCQNNKQEIRRKYNFNPYDKIIIHVGRLTPVKNQDMIIKGFARVVKDNHHVKLVIAGDGDLKPKLMNLVNELHLGENVVFTGLLPREEVYNLMKVSDAFILNSASEGLSVALLEAMALELPCILSDIPSFRETLQGIDIGEFIYKNTVEEVADSITRLLKTDELTLAVKKTRAFELVSNNYTINKTIETYQQIYTELLEEKTHA